MMSADAQDLRGAPGFNWIALPGVRDHSSSRRARGDFEGGQRGRKEGKKRERESERKSEKEKRKKSAEGGKEERKEW